jgi:hypothetical protein
LQQQGRLHKYAAPEHRLAAVSSDYTAKADRAVIVAPDIDERRELTELIRADLRQQGRLSNENHTVPVLVQQHFENPHLATNYAPSDEIRFRKGSLERHSIADNSSVTVLSVDRQSNGLTVETSTGHHVSYDPASLTRQIAQSAIYREEEREFAAGDRIQFSVSDREVGVRKGTFGAIERIAEDNAISVRLDNGKVVELTPEKSRHIDYGYAVESAQHLSADRVLITGSPSVLSEQQADLAKLSGKVNDLAIYTSDGYETHQNLLDRIPGLAATEGRSSAQAVLKEIPIVRELEGVGISL